MKTDILLRKNTIPLRTKLKDLGYNVCSCCTYRTWTWLHISEYGVHGIAKREQQSFLIEDLESCIDCGANEEMFIEEAKFRKYIEDTRSQPYTYTNEQIDANLPYFKKCMQEGLSAYKALLFFNGFLYSRV